jgi:uncharacterized membrane protein YedE/YeeE
MPTDFIHAFLGGLLIGTAVWILFAFSGKYAGISGITAQLLRPPFPLWAALFILGLPLGGLVYRLATGSPPEAVITAPFPLLVIAGLLVGVGTRVGNGCTSGHGVCGLGRLSKRSLVATCTFMALGMITVFLRGRFL